jgi:hypothetical protein
MQEYLFIVLSLRFIDNDSNIIMIIYCIDIKLLNFGFKKYIFE